MKKKMIFSYMLLATLSLNLNANNILSPQTIANNNSEESVKLTKSNFPLEEEQPIINEDTDQENKITFEEYKEIALNLSNGCLFLNASDKDPMVTIFTPDLDTFKLIKLGVEKENGKNGHISRGETFEKIAILSESINIYSANIRIQNKYRGDRESVFGKTFEKILPKKSYRGEILIDEYKSEMPMFWILNNEAQLTAIKNYFIYRLGELKNQMKPLLLIKILDTNNLNNLSLDNKIFLENFFVTVSTENKDIRDFFDKTKSRVIKYGSKMGSPRYKGETIIESIFRSTEKVFKEWKVKEWIISIGGIIVTTNTFDPLKSEFKAIGNFVSEKTRLNEAVSWLKKDKNTVFENVVQQTKKFLKQKKIDQALDTTNDSKSE